MSELPKHQIRVFGNDDDLPKSVEEMFAEELAESRSPLPADRADRGQWRFVNVSAVTPDGRTLGGVHVDVGPMNFGPLGDEKLAYIERVLVGEPFRRMGLGTALLNRAIVAARDAGATHARCNVRWDNPAGMALYRKCGFAITDVNEPDEGGWYFVVKPL